MNFIDSLSEARISEGEQLDLVSGRRLRGDQLIRRIDTKLGLRGACRCSTAQPGELLANQHVAPLLGDRGLTHALGLGEHVGAVAAVVFLDSAVDYLPHVLAYLIKEPAIMGDDKQAQARARLEVRGKPGDDLDIEMVGRLVEQQDVKVSDQQPREIHATALTA